MRPEAVMKFDALCDDDREVCLQISTNPEEGTFEIAIYNERTIDVYVAGSYTAEELQQVVRLFTKWQAETRFLTEG